MRLCVCGEPQVPDVIHRQDGPCYQNEYHEWPEDLYRELPNNGCG